MGRSIWKYDIIITDSVQNIEMPGDSTILHLGSQKGNICMWVMVNKEVEMATRHFKVYGTGHPLDDRIMYYVGTVIDESLNLVWHVYEVYITPSSY